MLNFFRNALLGDFGYNLGPQKKAALWRLRLIQYGIILAGAIGLVPVVYVLSSPASWIASVGYVFLLAALFLAVSWRLYDKIFPPE